MDQMSHNTNERMRRLQTEKPNSYQVTTVGPLTTRRFPCVLNVLALDTDDECLMLAQPDIDSPEAYPANCAQCMEQFHKPKDYQMHVIDAGHTRFIRFCQPNLFNVNGKCSIQN